MTFFLPTFIPYETQQKFSERLNCISSNVFLTPFKVIFHVVLFPEEFILQNFFDMIMI